VSEGASTPLPGDRFRLCVRAGGQAGGRSVNGCGVQIWGKSVLVTAPCSLLGTGALPFSLFSFGVLRDLLRV